MTSSNITVNVSHNGRSSSFSASVQLPSGSGPHPAVIVYGGFGADTATIRSAGAAVISFDPFSVGQEGTGRSNKQGAFYSIYGSSSSTGLLMAWAWGVSRIIDVIGFLPWILRRCGREETELLRSRAGKADPPPGRIGVQARSDAAGRSPYPRVDRACRRAEAMTTSQRRIQRST
ncbi:hypothetical protein O7610_15235 [Solwaraspora sp. WMMA2065]|nr:hypothetical protein [Solwaraspora sp. WMMA2065]WJK32147.1 hypothetical protein O7610_15235 [Solwaraspora sp. WMMA2065]